MIPQRFEYAFILVILAATGMSLTWNGLRRVATKRHTLVAIGLFLLYCLAIEIVALTLGWWTFDGSRVFGGYVWIIPVEELLLFLVFSIVVIGGWETLQDERD